MGTKGFITFTRNSKDEAHKIAMPPPTIHFHS